MTVDSMPLFLKAREKEGKGDINAKFSLGER